MHRQPSLPSPGRVLGALALALTVGVSGVLSDPASVRAMAPANTGPGGIGAWLDLGARLASPFQPLIDALGGSEAISTGSDGRLTFLLLGSDTRSSGIARTDSIIVMSIKGNTINAASIPRDMARIPNPYTANTTDYFSGRVNGLGRLFRSQGYSLNASLDRVEYVIEKMLGIEIDYRIMISFVGFMALVNNVDANGIPINVKTTIRDPKFWDDPNKEKGAYFPAGSGYKLYAWQPNAPPLLCNGLWKNYTNPPSSTWCHRAIVYVRSRKGTGNSDFKRARRQQDFVAATMKVVLGRGSGSALDSLRSAAVSQANAGHLHMDPDLPITAGNALALYNQFSGGVLVNQVVFSPTTYATHIPGTSAYAPKLSAIKAWASQYLK